MKRIKGIDELEDVCWPVQCIEMEKVLRNRAVFHVIGQQIPSSPIENTRMHQPTRAVFLGSIGE